MGLGKDDPGVPKVPKWGWGGQIPKVPQCGGGAGTLGSLKGDRTLKSPNGGGGGTGDNPGVPKVHEWGWGGNLDPLLSSEGGVLGSAGCLRGLGGGQWPPGGDRD